jgi:hypothetical protein
MKNSCATCDYHLDGWCELIETEYAPSGWCSEWSPKPDPIIPACPRCPHYHEGHLAGHPAGDAHPAWCDRYGGDYSGRPLPRCWTHMRDSARDTVSERPGYCEFDPPRRANLTRKGVW